MGRSGRGGGQKERRGVESGWGGWEVEGRRWRGGDPGEPFAGPGNSHPSLNDEDDGSSS